MISKGTLDYRKLWKLVLVYKSLITIGVYIGFKKHLVEYTKITKINQ